MRIFLLSWIDRLFLLFIFPTVSSYQQPIGRHYDSPSQWHSSHLPSHSHDSSSDEYSHSKSREAVAYASGYGYRLWESNSRSEEHGSNSYETSYTSISSPPPQPQPTSPITTASSTQTLGSTSDPSEPPTTTSPSSTPGSTSPSSSPSGSTAATPLATTTFLSTVASTTPPPTCPAGERIDIQPDCQLLDDSGNSHNPGPGLVAIPPTSISVLQAQDSGTCGCKAGLTVHFTKSLVNFADTNQDLPQQAKARLGNSVQTPNVCPDISTAGLVDLDGRCWRLVNPKGSTVATSWDVYPVCEGNPEVCTDWTVPHCTQSNPAAGMKRDDDQLISCTTINTQTGINAQTGYLSINDVKVFNVRAAIFNCNGCGTACAECSQSFLDAGTQGCVGQNTVYSDDCIPPVDGDNNPLGSIGVLVTVNPNGNFDVIGFPNPLDDGGRCSCNFDNSWSNVHFFRRSLVLGVPGDPPQAAVFRLGNSDIAQGRCSPNTMLHSLIDDEGRCWRFVTGTTGGGNQAVTSWDVYPICSSADGVTTCTNHAVPHCPANPNPGTGVQRQGGGPTILCSDIGDQTAALMPSISQLPTAIGFTDPRFPHARYFDCNGCNAGSCGTCTGLYSLPIQEG